MSNTLTVQQLHEQLTKLINDGWGDAPLYFHDGDNYSHDVGVSQGYTYRGNQFVALAADASHIGVEL